MVFLLQWPKMWLLTWFILHRTDLGEFSHNLDKLMFPLQKNSLWMLNGLLTLSHVYKSEWYLKKNTHHTSRFHSVQSTDWSFTSCIISVFIYWRSFTCSWRTGDTESGTEEPLFNEALYSRSDKIAKCMQNFIHLANVSSVPSVC